MHRINHDGVHFVNRLLFEEDRVPAHARGSLPPRSQKLLTQILRRECLRQDFTDLCFHGFGGTAHSVTQSVGPYDVEGAWDAFG